MFFGSPYIGFRVTFWNLLIYLAFLSLLIKKIMIGKPSVDFLLHKVLQTRSLPSFFQVKSRNDVVFLVCREVLHSRQECNPAGYEEPQTRLKLQHFDIFLKQDSTYL